jgi:N-acetylmuramoyl-L-alanine amidase
MRVCIDPGHGMLNASPRRFDPGAVAGSVREADVVLRYALDLRLACLDQGLEVVMTRMSNEAPMPLARRAALALEQDCDALVSIHCNAAESPQAHGTETLHREFMGFAVEMHHATVRAMGLRDRGLKLRPGMAVLKFPRPAALIELGFLSNDDDRLVMQRETVRQQFARRVSAALYEWD